MDIQHDPEFIAKTINEDVELIDIYFEALKDFADIDGLIAAGQVPPWTLRSFWQVVGCALKLGMDKEKIKKMVRNLLIDFGHVENLGGDNYYFLGGIEKGITKLFGSDPTIWQLWFDFLGPELAHKELIIKTDSYHKQEEAAVAILNSGVLFDYAKLKAIIHANELEAGEVDEPPKTTETMKEILYRAKLQKDGAKRFPKMREE